MATKKQEIAIYDNSVLINFDEISKRVKEEDLQLLADAIEKEMGDYQLGKEEREQLRELMNADALEAQKWKSVADVLKYTSIFALAESNPETLRKIIERLLGIVGLFYPVASRAGKVLALVPDTLFSGLIKIGGFATPEYLLYRGVSMVANMKSEKAKAQSVYDAAVGEDMTTLIIVCKNKKLSTELSRLINAEDDVDDETVVGTKDGTVHTIIWNESAWEAFREKLTTKDKVLIIGKVKNTAPLTAEQTRFSEFGVKYGWSNNIAMIEADHKALLSTKDYKDFLAALEKLQVTDKLKKDAKLKFDWVTAGKLAIFPPLLIGDLFHENTAVREQQLLYGLGSLYIRDLAEFLEQNS